MARLERDRERVVMRQPRQVTGLTGPEKTTHLRHTVTCGTEKATLQRYTRTGETPCSLVASLSQIRPK